MTDTSNEYISNLSHINKYESFSLNAASTITSGISLSEGNQSNPTTSTSTFTFTFTSTSTSLISVAPAQPNHSQRVKCNPNLTFQNLLEEAQQIYEKSNN